MSSSMCSCRCCCTRVRWQQQAWAGHAVHAGTRAHTHAHPVCSSCVLQDDKYRVQHRIYERQYAQLYFARLCMLSNAMRERVAAKWPGVLSESQQV